MTPQYAWTLLYDARQNAPSGVVLPAFGLLFIFIAILTVRFKRFERDERGEAIVRRGSGMRKAFVVLAILWTLVVTWTTVGKHFALRRALAENRFTLVEGLVERYTPEDYWRRKPETWTVAGHTYRLFTSKSPAGFGDPGVVRSGMRVRLADVDGAIARLEVAR